MGVPVILFVDIWGQESSQLRADLGCEWGIQIFPVSSLPLIVNLHLSPVKGEHLNSFLWFLPLLCISLVLCCLEAGLPELLSRGLLWCRISPCTEAQETTCTGSERTAGIHPHWNSCEIVWASLPTPGSQGCFVITTCLTPFHRRALSCPHVSVLIKLLFTILGSSLNFSREVADPGEGEESPWLLQGDFQNWLPRWSRWLGLWQCAGVCGNDGGDPPSPNESCFK